MNKQSHSQTTKVYFTIIVIFLLYLSWQLIAPFANAIIFGGIIAGSFLPFHKWLERKLQFSKFWSAILSTSLLLIMVITPATLIGIELVSDAMLIYRDIKQGVNHDVVEHFFSDNGWLAGIVKWIKINFGFEVSVAMIKVKVTGFAESILSYVISHFNSLVQNILTLTLNFIIVIISIFGFYSEGERLRDFIFKISPLPHEDEEIILFKFNEMNYVTMYGNGLGGIIQGVLAGFAFWLVGFQSIILLTVLMIILAFIPLLGISLVFIPACIFLWIKGEIFKSIMLFVFCAGVAFFVENIYKPKLMSKKVKVDSMMLLLFIMGGMSKFGPLGIFYGPIILIMALTLVDLYLKNYRGSES
jgi:predicted PurR-regulated permease PerM